MKVSRKVQARRRRVRRSTALSLSARVERLEKELLFAKPAAVAPPAITPAPAARFTKLGADGKSTTGDHVAVHDIKTGLIWSAEPVQAGKEFTHADALKACAELELLGAKDWRAPTIEELLSIVDYTRCNPAVDTDYFKRPYSWTWSTTLYKESSGYAWYVYLDYGFSNIYDQTFQLHVRAVRAGQVGA